MFSQLVGDMELLTRFHRVWEDLSVWATDTKSVLDVASTPSTSSSSSHARVTTTPHSSALLRGKQQVMILSK